MLEKNLISPYQTALELFMDDKWEKLTVDGMEIAKTKLKFIARGGSKIIIVLGNGEVLGLVKSADAAFHAIFVDTEVALAEHLKQAGLRALEYKKAMVLIDGHPLPMLKMPHFETLNLRGQQVRDRKNHESSCGSSMIFATYENLTSVEHWRRIFCTIEDDIVNYNCHSFNFDSDAFNLVIEDTEDTLPHANHTPVLFTERKQTIHLFFFDFSDKNRLYDKEKERYTLTHENIERMIDEDATRISSTIFLGVSSEEYQLITGEGPSFCAALNLSRYSQEARETAWKETRDRIIERLKSTLELKSDAIPKQTSYQFDGIFASSNIENVVTSELNQMQNNSEPCVLI